MLFLIEYGRGRGTLVSTTKFSEEDRRRAEGVRLDREIELNTEGVEREIVLLEADDEASLRVTHRRYFESLAQLAVLPVRG